jgi:hypothetical protein
MKKTYDIHFVATASDWINIEANSETEAEKKFLKLLEEEPDYILELLRNSIQYVEIPSDITVDDTVEVDFV